MATESPMMMVEGAGARKWPSSTDSAMLGSPLKDLGAEEMGLLLKGYKLQGDQTEKMPSRSGSAPPSMEGSFAAIGNLLAQQNFSMSSSFENFKHAFENYESEEQLRSDPAYFAYYCSNVNMNPRLPPPLISRENRRLVRHIGGFGNNWRSSLDDSESVQLSRGSLSTHKEEPEEDRSPRETSENSSVTVSGQSTIFSAGRHKSLVDLIQEDFPRTPSPVYSQSRSSSHTAEEITEHDVHAISSSVSAMNISKAPESNSGSSDVCDDSALEHALRLVSDNGPSGPPFSGPSHQDVAPHLVDDSSAKSSAESDTSIKAQAGIGRADLRLRNKLEDQQAYGRNMMQHHLPTQQGDPYQSLVSPQGMNQSHMGVENFSYGHPKFSMEGHSSLTSASVNPPIYASTGGYVTAGPSFFPNYHPSGLYSPQYALGGYPMGSTLLPPFMSGYPSHATIPMPFGAGSGQNFDGRNPGTSAGQNMQQLSGLHHGGKFYGQHGLMLQPSFVDPLHMQYIQYPYGDVYNAVQHNRFPYGGGAASQIDSLIQQKESAIGAYFGDPKLEPPTNGSLSLPNPGKGGIAGGNYYGGHANMGLMTQFPASPLASPVLPSSPVGGINHLGRRNDLRFHEGSSRNAGAYAGGQGQRVNSFDDPKRHYFLEELKSSNGRKFELSDIAGRIVEFRQCSEPNFFFAHLNNVIAMHDIFCVVDFSVDQHGSRFIQQKLEHCSIEEKISVFNEVIPHAPKLMTDVFGNYVIQKFFEHGSAEQRKELADKLAGQMVQLSLQMYGCRVIQKALEVIELDQKAVLVRELDGHVMRCVRDQNGNHVIQKCIESVPAEHIEFIISAFRGHVATLSTHPYGCRVIQRVLEHCPDDGQSQYIVHEILDSAYHLAQDQYGNYVTQHVLERGKPDERCKIINNFNGKIVQMSQHKYASNVIEKCLEYGDASERDLLIEEIIGQSEESLLAMMKDQFANYVVQKILEKSSDKQQEILLNRIRGHLNALKKYTYGKHIVTRFEQLCGDVEEGQAAES